jgi:hypothetical protein
MRQPLSRWCQTGDAAAHQCGCCGPAVAPRQGLRQCGRGFLLLLLALSCHVVRLRVRSLAAPRVQGLTRDDAPHHSGILHLEPSSCWLSLLRTRLLLLWLPWVLKRLSCRPMARDLRSAIAQGPAIAAAAAPATVHEGPDLS